MGIDRRGRMLTLVVSGVRACDGPNVGLLGGRRRPAVLGWHRRGGLLPAAAVVLGEPLPAAPLGLVELREHVKPAGHIQVQYMHVYKVHPQMFRKKKSSSTNDLYKSRSSCDTIYSLYI
jgi:hypothetical protein